LRFRHRRQAEQPTDRLVHDPSGHVIPEGDGAVQGAGKLGNQGGPG
jgi:hypothetical protein